MPPILEYEIINAPKFTSNNDDLFIITFLLVKIHYQIQTTSTLILASQKHLKSSNHPHQIIGKPPIGKTLLSGWIADALLKDCTQ